jgi:hypothetical protein
MVGFIIGVVLTGVVFYFRDSRFRANLSADYNAFLTEITTLRGKVVKGETVIETDFRAIEQAFIKVFSKL